MVVRKTFTGIDIKRAKLELYHLLVTADVEDLTDGDVEVMTALAKDPEIQKVLDE